MSLIHRSWGKWVCLASVVIGLVSLTGCTKLLVRSDPPDARILMENDGRPVSSSDGRNFELKFPGRYTVTALPNAEQASDMQQSEPVEVDKAYFNTLPLVSDNVKHRTITLKLQRREYTTVVEVLVVPDLQTGKLVGYVLESRSFFDETEVGGAAPTLIADLGLNTGIEGLAISPDGDRIVYSVANVTGGIDELKRLREDAGLREVDIASANLRGLSLSSRGIQHITTEDFKDRFPVFTPEGDKLLFASDRRRRGSQDILMISAHGRSGVSNIYTEHRNARLSKPSQANDKTIAFTVELSQGRDASQRSQVWTLGGANQFPTQVTLGTQPAISPDGKQIAYIGVDGNLWVVAVDGSNATQLTFAASAIQDRYRSSLAKDELALYDMLLKRGAAGIRPYSYPSWSADGSYLFYTAMEGNDPTGRPNEDIWLMKINGGSKQQLTTNGSADRYPLATPEGDAIYFMSNRGQRWAIWRIPVTLGDGG